ncbi:hypothetical protein [Streptomyces sp. TRM68367]|uniref:hypothetical protein n=1 Tax=Streptomyces sp. TRM68367 TaxID=2758415 RepID=UPI0037DD48FC
MMAVSDNAAALLVRRVGLDAVNRTTPPAGPAPDARRAQLRRDARHHAGGRRSRRRGPAPFAGLR